MNSEQGVSTTYRIVLAILEAIPLPIRAFLFESILLLVWAIDAKHRRIARVNLRIAFPEMGDRGASRIIRRCYVRMGTSAAEFIHLPKMDRAYVQKHFRIEGAHHFAESKARTGLLLRAVTVSATTVAGSKEAPPLASALTDMRLPLLP